MKIKTRKARLMEYNEQYPRRIDDPTEALRQYFRDNGLNLEKACAKARKKALEIIEKREYETIHILAYEFPMKTDRPRTSNGHTFSPNAAENKNYFRSAIHQVAETIKLINTPGEIYVDAYFKMPKQVPPDEIILFESKLLMVEDKPDYDNVGKCYTDVLTDVLISDDDIFWRGQVSKYYSVIPRVEILIRYITKHESDYIYKKLRHRKSIKAGIESGQIVLQRLGD